MSKEIKLNLGCYNKKIHGFINIDVRSDTNPDLVENCLTLPSFKENSISLIYASHFFEHLDFQQGIQAIKRYFDLLIPSGILRLAVPDMEATFAHYFYWKDLNILYSALWGSQRHEFDRHLSGYDEKTLTELFLNTGFSTVEKWKWQDVEHGFCDDYSQAYYPYQQKYGLIKGEETQIGKAMSLNLEGKK